MPKLTARRAIHAISILLLLLVALHAYGEDSFLMDHATNLPESVWSTTLSSPSTIWPMSGAGVIAVDSGEAWLRTVLLDESGTALTGESTSPKVLAGSGPTYVASQAPQPSEMAHSVRMEFWVNGRASITGAALVSLSPPFMNNADFEMPLDKKNRVPMWSEEILETLEAGTRGGAVTLETQTHPNSGAASQSLSLAPPDGWCAMGSLNYPLPGWATEMHGEVYARCADSEARALLVWTDDGAQNVLRVDRGDAYSGTEGRRIRTPVAEAPAGAAGVRLVLLAKTGKVWFDDAALVTDPPKKRIAKVLVNQAGYELNGPKSAVIMTNFFPDDSTEGTITVSAGTQDTAPFVTKVKCDGRILGEKAADWGWFFWRGDFSGVQQSGRFTVKAVVGVVEAESPPFEISEDTLFKSTAARCVDFFFVQRCGFEVPDWHKACHLDDAKLKDGSHRDLTGGWHSAGDYNKITWEYGDGGVMYALVNAYETAPQFFGQDRDSDGLANILDEARWGAQYLAKLQIPDSGGFYNHIEQGPDRSTWMKWSPPEDQTDGQPGTADDPIVLEGEGHSPLAIGAWARLGKVLDGRGIANDYLTRALANWEHEKTAGEGSPLLLISSVDLYLVTNEERFLEFARRSAGKILETGPAEGMLAGGYANSGDVPAAALAHFAAKLPSDPLTPQILERLKSHLSAFVAEPDNAFGLTMQQSGPEGFYFEPTSALGHNYEYLCRAWSALKIYKVLPEPRALAYALDQINFVLGCNPYNLCMFEGVGSVNPPRYHHRYNTIPGRERGAVPGAIPNGFVRDVSGMDRPGFDLSMKGRAYPSYRTSEPWLVHNVFYLLAVTSLHDALAGSTP